LSLGLSVALASSGSADDPCAAFTWDVGHERTLFGQQAQPLDAGQMAAASPALAIDRLYQLQLKTQPQVTFVAQPGKKLPNEAESFAGLASLTVETGGVYRIALDQGLWVDVIANGTVLQARDFQGRRGCNAPHKVVEFLLPVGSPITLQFSGSSVAVVKVAVTRSPGGTSQPFESPINQHRR